MTFASRFTSRLKCRSEKRRSTSTQWHFQICKRSRRRTCSCPQAWLLGNGGLGRHSRSRSRRAGQCCTNAPTSAVKTSLTLSTADDKAPPISTRTPRPKNAAPCFADGMIWCWRTRMIASHHHPPCPFHLRVCQSHIDKPF